MSSSENNNPTLAPGSLSWFLSGCGLIVLMLLISYLSSPRVPVATPTAAKPAVPKFFTVTKRYPDGHVEMWKSRSPGYVYDRGVYVFDDLGGQQIRVSLDGLSIVERPPAEWRANNPRE